MPHADDFKNGNVRNSLSGDGTLQIFRESRNDFIESSNVLIKYLKDKKFETDATLIECRINNFMDEIDVLTRQASVGNTADRQEKLSAALRKIHPANEVIYTVQDLVKAAVENTSLTTEHRAVYVKNIVDVGVEGLLELGKEGMFIRAAATRASR